MKRIKKIELNNFKGLYGKNEINLTKAGKNLMLYGENGSGKSSFTEALNLFFSASASDIIIGDSENIFIKSAEKGKTLIKLSIGEKGYTRSRDTVFTLDKDNKQISDSLISQANQAKGYLNYKSLLKTHFVDTDRVNLFELLVENLLQYFENPVTKNLIKDDWVNLRDKINADKRTKEYKELIETDILKNFNNGLTLLLKDVVTEANKLIDEFKYNIKIHLDFNNLTIGRENDFANKNIILEIDFFDKKKLTKHHHFLNEARLTAISIAIYLGAVLSNPPQTDLKLLILDDIFIGLDTSNRLPLLKILNEKFSDYQIFMTTYDKAWYELVKSDNLSNWTFAELYIKEEHQNGYEIPILHNETDFITIAEDYLNNLGDYKASATYIRSEFEKLLKNYCDKNNIEVIFRKQSSKMPASDFWDAIKDKLKRGGSRIIVEQLRNDIETQRTLVLNPFVHYDINKPQFRAELVKTINLVKQLKSALS